MLSSNLINGLRSLEKTINLNSSIEFVINTDSRTFKSGETFVALVGENFDGYSYLDSVLEKSARAVICKNQPERVTQIESWAQLYPDTAFILVSDTLHFMQELASVYVQKWKSERPERKIISVTGSNGKTTHKEMIFYLLNNLFPGKVLATKGNLNNHIGVPLTIFNLAHEHDIAIIEMGMNHAGEIQVLCDIAHPEHGMITNIGAAHIEFLKSMDNIFQEKGSLYRNVLKNSKGNGVFVINADDPYLAKLEKSDGLCTYGEKSGDVRISISKDQISFHIKNQEVLITNKNISEHHNLKNLAGTAIFAINLFPEKVKEVEKSASSYQQPSMNRSQWIGNIFLDAYNANPSSMKVSLDSFSAIMQDKGIKLDECYFVLGDMNELGEFAKEMHKEIAEHVNTLGIKNVSFIGRYKDFYLEGYENPTSHHLLKEDFLGEWKTIRKSYRYIFVKASRSLKLETLMDIV